MRSEDQDRVVVVLVRARNPQNIGAVARAMHDLGYSRLRVVNEFPVPLEAAKSAVDASSVLDTATTPATVAAAVADCTLVLGTTAVGERVLEHPLYPLPQAVEMVAAALEDRAARVALLFGSEKTGLSNDELSHCHALLTIPMNTPAGGKHLSMNLGQAAAVCLYALAQGESSEKPAEVEAGAAAGELERVTGLMMEALATSGYARRHPANARENNVRRMVMRMGLTAVDAAMWTGILRQMLHGLGQQQKRSGDVETVDWSDGLG